MWIFKYVAKHLRGVQNGSDAGHHGDSCMEFGQKPHSCPVAAAMHAVCTTVEAAHVSVQGQKGDCAFSEDLPAMNKSAM